MKQKMVHICDMVSGKDYDQNLSELTDQCVANEFGYVDDLKHHPTRTKGRKA